MIIWNPFHTAMQWCWRTIFQMYSVLIQPALDQWGQGNNVLQWRDQWRMQLYR